MHRRTLALSLGSALAAALIAGLRLGVPRAASAAAPPSYKLQPIAALGDTVAGVLLPKNGNFYLGGISDDGQILFDVFTTTDRLIQYAGGKFTPIAIPGGDGPNGKWPSNFSVFGPWSESMNQSGEVVYAASGASGNPGSALGTYLWDPRIASSTPVALKKMPAAGGLTFTDPGGFCPSINNHGEVALVAGVSGPGGVSGYGLFFRAVDGSYQTVLLPGQALPGGEKHRPRIGWTPRSTTRGRSHFRPGGRETVRPAPTSGRAARSLQRCWWGSTYRASGRSMGSAACG
jgi:hypothetical protein